MGYKEYNQQHQMDNYGDEGFGWSPQVSDYKVILEQLKSQDEMIIYEAVMNLQQQLSIAQDNTLSNFAVDQYIAVLIEILKRPPMSDFTNEINMFAIQCLTNLMDIFPNICNNIVKNGGVKCFAQVLERSMGFIDLNEACIKALEKISTENPHAILTSGAMNLVLNMMDFFEINTQKRIISIILNISRHSATEQDLNENLLPLLPCLCMLLHSRGSADSLTKVESVSTIVLRLAESIFRFISPHSQPEKFAGQFEKLGSTGIIEAIIQSLQDYCIFENTLREAGTAQQQSAQKIMSVATVQNFLKILSMCAGASIRLTRQLLDSNIFKLIECFLPSQEDQKKLNFNIDQYPFIAETISMIDQFLPNREDPQVENVSEHSKMRAKLEAERRELFQELKNQQVIFFAAEKLLPKIFNVHENNFTQGIRIKTLQAIDKLILLFNEELLNNFIEPYSFAKFINTNLRTNTLSSIHLCLQMIDKLMKSNPKNYTMPLVREGIATFIKGFKTLEDLEKLCGITLNAEVEEVDQQASKHEDFLSQAKNMLIRGPGSEDSSEQRMMFEQTIQKYMELARVSSQSQSVGASLVQTRSQVKSAKQVLALAETLRASYFENQEFLKKINEGTGGDDLQVMNNLKQLAADIIEEGAQEVFEFGRNRDLMKRLGVALTKQQRAIMSYEFKESGILDALKVYLTMTSKQINLYQQEQKALSTGEEVKRSEEMKLSSISKSASKVSKKEARTYIQRLKVFLHVILHKQNNKQPLIELVNLCHEFLSQSENLIFEGQHSQQQVMQESSTSFGGFMSLGQPSSNDPNQSMMALRQLTRRLRVNLVYDPIKSSIKKDLIAKETSTQLISEPMMQPPSLAKAQSHKPAFMMLADHQESGEAQSKVFVRRNFLYNELKQVMVSVEQCASLFLLEDFLRNRIKTMDDVKTLKTPQSFLGDVKGSNPSKSTRPFFEQALDQMRDLLDIQGSREAIKLEHEDFSRALMDRLFAAKELNELDHIDILRQLEIHSLQMMDDFYADQENQDSYDDGSDQNLPLDERLYEFQRTVNRLREDYRKRRMQERYKPTTSSAEKRRPLEEPQPKAADVAMKEEQPSASQSPMEEEEESKSSGEKEPRAVNNGSSDVDMTDEEEEEQRRQMEEVRRRVILRQEVVLTPADRQDKEAINDDLEQLIKANGDDIEFQFFIAGEPVPPNQTIYEIMRQIESKTKKQQKQKAQELNSAISSIMQMLQGREGDTLTVHFCIKDKQDNIQKSRKDSMMEFSQKRERTKSEAFDEISVSTVNQLVQTLIEKEFQVVGKDFLDHYNDKHFEEKKQLESSLKILKVLNYLSRNINLFTQQGVKFLITSHSMVDEEIKDDGFQDLDLHFGVQQIQPNLFHHHKLDSYILKNIQDPYNLISGAVSETLTQIFRSCPFLFPFQTRLLFFKLISFIGSIDMNRSIFFLRQFLKQKMGKLPPEDKNAVKIQRQKVVIDRQRILECSFNLMSKISNRAFLEVEYKDEIGTGLGPTLEYYYLVSQEIKNYKTPTQQQPVWRQMPDNTLFPGPISVLKMSPEELQKVYEVFRLSGMMIAKSISDDRLIDLPLSPLFWDLVLGKKMNIFDIERLDNDLYKVFADLQLLANKRKEIDKAVFADLDQKQRALANLKTKSGARVEDLSLSFILPGYDDLELKPDGKNTDVTLENLQEYLDLAMHYLFHETVKIQIQAFKKGFNQIFPVDNLKPFSSSSIELEDMICGTQRNEEEWTSVQKLQEYFIPAHGYHQKSPGYLNLLRFVTELDKEGRRSFLLFMTGSPRLPNGGFAGMDPKFTVVLKKPEVPKGTKQAISQEIINSSRYIDEILPSVMTCQNYIKLPSYSTYEVLKAKLEKAYTQGQGNFSLT